MPLQSSSAWIIGRREVSPEMNDIASDDIGGRLRRARTDRGLSLHEVARRTRLSIAVLRAIERNDFESLPAGIYRKAYLRTLAMEVGLDANAIAAEFDKRFESTAGPAAVVQGNTREDRVVARLADPRLRSVVSLLGFIALAAVWFAQTRDAAPTDAASTLISELSASHALLDNAGISIERIGRFAEPIANVSPIDVALRIEISAAGRCWVAAESDGERVIYRLMEPGERAIIEGERTISLRLGDGGSVMLSINGGARRAPGGAGEVVELEVTPDTVDTLQES